MIFSFKVMIRGRLLGCCFLCSLKSKNEDCTKALCTAIPEHTSFSTKIVFVSFEESRVKRDYEAVVTN